MKASRFSKFVVSLLIVFVWVACLGAFTIGATFIDDSVVELKGWIK